MTLLVFDKKCHPKIYHSDTKYHTWCSSSVILIFVPPLAVVRELLACAIETCDLCFMLLCPFSSSLMSFPHCVL